MATTKNITMKQFNGTDYDTLYPKTVYNQVSGVAPDGYGLGRNNGKSISNCNDAIQNGWYVTDGNTTNGPVNPANSAALNYLTLLVSSGAERIRQIAFVATQNYNEVATRYSSDSGSNWSEWEWVNPPMKLGVEYRTTERYLGKPVYTQVISIGAIGSGSGNVEHGIPDISVVVGLIGTNSYGPTLNTHPYMTVFYANSQYVRWETTQAISGTSYAVLRYTKTTD